jgi:hypothetical protein
MLFKGIALAALAAAQAAAPQSDVQWVPLKGSPAAKAEQARAATIQSAPTAAIAPAAPQAVILAPAAGSVLRAGTEVPLRLEEGLDSNDKTIREGTRFRMTVANDVWLGNVVVIPAGSPATGEVTDLRRKGMWGKSGRIVARVINARVGDRLIRLSGSFDDKGVTGTAGVVGAIVFVPIAGFFLTGTSAKMPAGSGVKAFLDEDLAIAVPQAAPIAAPAPVQAAVPAPAQPH